MFPFGSIPDIAVKDYKKIKIENQNRFVHTQGCSRLAFLGLSLDNLW
nr:MAG TPA: hypothetical protein [Caudoviricetes sp.]